MALLIPKNFNFMGKSQKELYAEAMNKKEQPKQQRQESKPIKPTVFTSGNVIPLIGSDGKTNEFTVMEALVEAQKNGKTLASLKDADAYVLKNGGWHWTGEAILYPGPKEKFGQKITYTDSNGVEYGCAIPFQFRNETGKAALKLMNGYFNNDINAPFFEFREGADGIWALQINKPDALINAGHLKAVPIYRQNGWYLTDSEALPNGKKSDSTNQDARYFYQVGDGSYLGLLLRDVGGGRQVVVASRRPSGRHRVLVYE